MKEQNLLLLAITIVMVKFQTTSEEMIMKCALRVEKDAMNVNVTEACIMPYFSFWVPLKKQNNAS